MIGVDPNAAALYDGYRRAQKAKLSNAMFVVAAAEALPASLAGRADQVRIQFPWGSLLAAILHADRTVLGAVAGLLRPGGELHLLLSVVERDRVAGTDRLDERGAREVASRLVRADVGLVLEQLRLATPEDVAASHSRWAKRLDAGGQRPTWLMDFRKKR